MSDMVKEIFAGTLTVADISSTGSATLVSTNANTQYVIKDVTVSGTFVSGDNPGLYVNDHRVADLYNNASGSEIVDINSTLKYQAYATAPTLQQRTVKLVSGSSSNYYFDNSQSFELNGASVSTATSSSVKLNSDLTGVPSVSEFAQSNDGSIFYVRWDGNSSVQLYKRAGGINGSESSIVNLTYGWIIFNQIDSYLYGQWDNSQLYKYNINTNQTSAVAQSFTLSTTSYPSASLMNNGNILVNPSGNGQTGNLYILNPVLNTSTNISGLTSVSTSGNNYKISGYFDYNTNLYTFYKRQGPTLYKHQLNGVVTLGQGYSGGVTNTNYTIGTIGPSSNNYNNAYTSVDATNYTVAKHGVAGKTQLETFNTVTQTTTTTDWLPYRTESNTIIQNYTVGAGPSYFPNTVKVRITGVKTTL